MIREEQHIQMMVVNWVQHNYPNLIFTCAPGNAKSPRQGVLNKRMGYCKGWPDLFFAYPKNGYFGLFIELKSSKGHLDKETQAPLLDKLNALGYKAVCCYGYDEAINILKKYLQ